jgi:hypothetical protein
MNGLFGKIEAQKSDGDDDDDIVAR